MVGTLHKLQHIVLCDYLNGTILILCQLRAPERIAKRHTTVYEILS